jgi:hypothetical protein
MHTKKMLFFGNAEFLRFFSITKHVLELYQWKNKLLAISFAFFTLRPTIRITNVRITAV